MKQSPWVARFDGLDNRDVICRSLTYRPEPVSGLNTMPVEDAGAALADALKTIFLPNEQSIDIALRLLGAARAYSSKMFPDEKAYLGHLYETPRPPQDFSAICLSGQSGVGKSALLRAIERAFPPPAMVEPGEGHGAMPLVSMWTASVDYHETPLELLHPFAQGVGEEGIKLSRTQTITQARKNAFRQGVPLIALDELQFLTTSSAANVRVAKTIQQFAMLSPPFIFSANFSLVNKLLRRPPESRQRILSNPIVLLPDGPQSMEWQDYLKECCRVSGGVINISPERDGLELYSYTAGLKRLVILLFAEAYRTARKQGRHCLNKSDVVAAYASLNYASNREIVEVIRDQAISNRCIDPDYWCPLTFPTSVQASQQDHWRTDRKDAFAERAFQASLTLDEKKAFAELESARHADSKDKVKKPRKKKPKTAAELIAEGQRMVESLKKKK